MKSIWDTCEFRDEILSSDFANEKFAAELYDFLNHNSDAIYQDPKLFFENTFPTDQMKLLLHKTLKRLESGGGEAVTVVNTGFGGGKTHTILLLYHILKNPEYGIKFLGRIHKHGEEKMDKIPNARVVAIDCREITKNTIWGEIAHQLGEYHKFENYDMARHPPKNITEIQSLISKEPTLLLIDELPQYLLKANAEKIGNETLNSLTTTFLMELISAFASSNNSSMIMTLTEKQDIYKEQTDKMLKIIDKITQATSRKAYTLTPVTKDQIYDVIRTRLVKSVNEAGRNGTVKEYCEYYRNNGINLQHNFEETFARSYPFHPTLIDTLYERITTISQFNQTRGLLRLLSTILRRLFSDRQECIVLGMADVPLWDHEIADELTVRLGKSSLRTVIDVDCIQHAQKLDESSSVKVAESAARAIFLYSLHGYPNQTGLQIGRLKLAIGRPGIDPALIEKSLEEISKSFWYLQDKNMQEFYFKEAPNVNKIIHDYSENITQDEIKKGIHDAISHLVQPSIFRVTVWDKYKVEDDAKLKIFIADYETPLASEEDARSYFDDMLKVTASQALRMNQNTIVFAYANSDYVHLMKEHARFLLAVRKAKNSDEIKSKKQFTRQIGNKEEDAKCRLNQTCRAAYMMVAYPFEDGLRFDQIHVPDSKQETISGAIAVLLEAKGKLIENPSGNNVDVPESISDIKSISEEFARNKSKPFLINEESLAAAIKDGIREKRFGVCKEKKQTDGKYEATYDPNDFSWEGYIVNSKLVCILVEPLDRKSVV